MTMDTVQQRRSVSVMYYLKSEKSNFMSSLPPSGLKGKGEGKKGILKSLGGQMSYFKKIFWCS